VLAVAGLAVAVALAGTGGGDGDDGAKGRNDTATSPDTGSGTGGEGGGKTSPDPDGGSAAGDKDTAGSGAGPDDRKGRDDKGNGSDDQGKGTGSGENGSDDGTTAGPTDGALPKGWYRYRNPAFHFTIGLPDGWGQRGTAGQGSGVKLGKAGSAAKVQVDFSPRPGQDAAQAWRELERSVSRSSADYRRLSLKPVEWRGYRTVADWEFTRKGDNGVTERVLNRGFVVDDSHAYAIMFTAPAAEWDSKANKQARQTFFASFAPLD
jgi:hypothetical protein